jgi:hypothetical protein
MDITLNWVGPYSFGHFSELSQYPFAGEPHVYVGVQALHSRKIAAVGKAANLSSRMNEYLKDLLCRQYDLSHEDPKPNSGRAIDAKADGLAVFDSLDEWLGAAVAEVKGFSFFAAPCDLESLDSVEAELIDRLRWAAENSRGRIVSDSWKKESNLPSGELTLKYQYSNPAAQAVLEFIADTPAPARETGRHDSARSTSPLGPEVYTYSAPGMPMCPDCEQRPAIFYCATHQSAVCLECVAKHDARGGCVYLPAFRAPKPAAGQAATSGSANPPGVGKRQSILGI